MFNYGKTSKMKPEKMSLESGRTELQKILRMNIETI